MMNNSINPLSLWLSVGNKASVLDKQIDKIDQQLHDLREDQVRAHNNAELKRIELEGKRAILCKQQDYINATTVQSGEL